MSIEAFDFIDKNEDGDKVKKTTATTFLYNKLSAQEVNLLRDKLNETIDGVNFISPPLYGDFVLAYKADGNLERLQLEVGDIVGGYDGYYTYDGGDPLLIGSYTAIDRGLLKLDQTTPQTIENGIPLLKADPSDYNDKYQLANKGFVESVLGFLLGFYFNNTADALGGIYYQMTDNDKGEGASTLVSGTLTTGNNQALFNFITEQQLSVDKLNKGIFSVHLHTSKTGTKSVGIKAQVYKRTIGGVETLIGESTLPQLITGTQTQYDIDISVLSETVLALTDKLVVKFLCDVGATGSDVTVTLFLENDYDSRITVPIESSVLSNVFIRKDTNLTNGKTTPIGADSIPIFDSVAGFFKYLTFTNLVSYLSTIFQSVLTALNFGSFIDSLDTKPTLVDTDKFIIKDVEDSDESKGVYWSTIYTKIYDIFTNLFLTPQFTVDINRQGITSRAETTIAFDGTNTFTITPTGTTWSYYRLGLKYTITGAKSVVIPGTPIATGTWFIYLNSTDGTLTASQTVWTLTDGKIPVASINFNDSLTPKYWMSDERHSAVIDSYMQYYLHNVDGARSLNTPTLAGYTVDTDTNAAKTFSISAGTLVDQDIVHSLSSLTDPNGTATDYVVWYRTGANTWVWKLSNMPFLYNSGTDWIQYDNAGTATDLTGGAGANTRWTNSYLLMTNKGGASRFVIVPGRAVFTSLAAAKAESISTFTWDGFPIAESVIAYQLTWSTVTSTSQGKCRLAAAPTLVNISTVTNNSSGSGTDHNTLSNLQGGTIGEYYHITAAQASKLDSDRLEETNVATTKNIDWSAYEVFKYVMTANTTFSDINLPSTGSKTITLHLSGNYTPTYPTGWDTYVNGTYDGAVLNTIVVQYVKAATPFYKMQITQPD